jgi:hypothetical protein
MVQKVCLNPECNKIYTVEDNKADDEVCSYDCFEKMFCHEPCHEIFESIEMV